MSKDERRALQDAQVSLPRGGQSEMWWQVANNLNQRPMTSCMVMVWSNATPRFALQRQRKALAQLSASACELVLVRHGETDWNVEVLQACLTVSHAFSSQSSPNGIRRAYHSMWHGMECRCTIADMLHKHTHSQQCTQILQAQACLCPEHCIYALLLCITDQSLCMLVAADSRAAKARSTPE